MEHVQLTAQGINVISLVKNKKEYGMTCAWATQVDYDKVIMLIGGQSETGKQITEGMRIGFSALNEKQADIAVRFGTSHSLETSKFNHDMEYLSNVPVVKNATREIVGKVLDIRRFDEDLLIIIQVEEMKTSPVSFLTFEKMPKF